MYDMSTSTTNLVVSQYTLYVDILGDVVSAQQVSVYDGNRPSISTLITALHIQMDDTHKNQEEECLFIRICQTLWTYSNKRISYSQD